MKYANDGFTLSSNWQGRMSAVADGAIDYDDIESLVMECAMVADNAVEATQEQRQREARDQGLMDITPLWLDVAPMLVDGLLREQSPESRSAAHLIQMGQVADAVEAGKLPS